MLEWKSDSQFPLRLKWELDAMGKEKKKKKDKKPLQRSSVSFHKDHCQWVKGRKRTALGRRLMGYEGFPLQHNETLVNKMSGQW